MKLQGSNILGQEQIDLLTTRGLNFVWFPKQLETIYRFQYQNGAAYEFRYRAPIILILCTRQISQNPYPIRVLPS